MPTVEQIRAQFPALTGGYVFMDNAGGSQVPGVVADAVRNYMTRSYVQVGADYPASQQATETVAEAHRFIEQLMGGRDEGRAILGPSTTALLRLLANCYADVWAPGDEIVVAENGHEANIGPWVALERRGMKVRWWRADPQTGHCSLDDLARLLTPHTRLVALAHTSNILGGVEDLPGAIALAHSVGAKVVADGVAYAPHRPMSVADWGVDWYVFSTYKVFGPHMAALWGTHAAQAEIEGPNHFFVPRDAVPYKFELGGVLHEGCAGLVALGEYMGFLAGPGQRDDELPRAFEAIARHEDLLTTKLLAFIEDHPNVRIFGQSKAGPHRLPTVSFTHASVPSRAIADEAAKHGIGMRWGHFYAYRLLQRMGLNPEEGVARVSLAHTNTLEELDRLEAAIGPLLSD